MNIEIISTPFNLSIHGFSGTAAGIDPVPVVFGLMGRMWEVIKTNQIKNKGHNVWVYEPGGKVFAGVELEDGDTEDTGLEKMDIRLTQYGWYKHVGPYSLIRRSGMQMREEISAKGFEMIYPYIEIYGHWNDDESKLETELLMCLK